MSSQYFDPSCASEPERAPESTIITTYSTQEQLSSHSLIWDSLDLPGHDNLFQFHGAKGTSQCQREPQVPITSHLVCMQWFKLTFTAPVPVPHPLSRMVSTFELRCNQCSLASRVTEPEPKQITVLKPPMKFLRSQGVILLKDASMLPCSGGLCQSATSYNIIVRQASRLGFAALARRQFAVCQS